MIRLNCFIEVSPNKREDVIAEAKALTKASLKDIGCVAYDIFESSTRENVLMICETWTDESALAAHANTTHFKLYVSNIEKKAKITIEKFVK